jgi:sugar/nucleoside kinase (ribokinase family)
MNSYSRIIVAGRITLDCYAYNKKFVIDNILKKYFEIESGKVFIGGSAGNIAIWLAAIKCPVLLSFSAGKDNASILLKSHFNKFEIPTYIENCDICTSISIVIVDKHAEPYYLHSQGANIRFNLSLISNLVKSDDILVIAGIPLLDSLHKNWHAFYNSLKEKPKMLITTFCHGGREGIHYPILDNTNILFGNEEELLPYSLNMKYLFEKYNNLHSVIKTKGRKGAIIFSREEEIMIPSVPNRIIDTCGAGDAFVAGTLAGIYNGQKIRESCVLGSYLASICCSNIGPSCPPSNLYSEVCELFPWINNCKKEF